MTIQRADKLLLEQGLVKSRTAAQRVIEAGKAEYEDAGLWRKIEKPSQKFEQNSRFRLLDSEQLRYVSRAGLKLEGALKHIWQHDADFRLDACVALDVGQSTGGFTDCLLKHQCPRVVGVDVGRGQLEASIRRDPRVECHEGVNARDLSSEQFEGLFDVVVMDVSFISQTLILPGLPELMKPGARLISLVKPQFEVGPEGIAKGGLVKNKHLYTEVKHRICTLLERLGFEVTSYIESCIEGGDGNTEFFAVAKLKP